MGGRGGYEALGQLGNDSNVIPRRARPGLAGLGPQSGGTRLVEKMAESSCWREKRRFPSASASHDIHPPPATPGRYI